MSDTMNLNEGRFEGVLDHPSLKARLRGGLIQWSSIPEVAQTMIEALVEIERLEEENDALLRNARSSLATSSRRMVSFSSPDTSIAAAEGKELNVGTENAAFLVQYLGASDGLTAYEAWDLAQAVFPREMHSAHHRASDLKKRGYVEPRRDENDVVMRRVRPETGKLCEILWITPAGEILARDLLSRGQRR